MRAVNGGLLVFVGLIALWVVLTGRTDAFSHFWTELTTGSTPTASNSTNGTSPLDQIKKDISTLPNPPKLPPSVVNDPFWNMIKN